MILHRVELRQVGPFTGTPATAGPFTAGLNILAAPNETGKTTLLKAAGRALFDRHNCRDAEIKSLRPAGSDLAPWVAVEFETGAGRYRIEKTFLQAPRADLFAWRSGEWKPLAQTDDADNRLAELLQSTPTQRGASKAAHWGLLGYLWMRQGETPSWPDWTANPAGRVVQGLLAKVELDPFIESVRGRLRTIYEENFTPTGRPAAGGTLHTAGEALAGVEGELAQLRVDRDRLTSDDAAFGRFEQELPRLETEYQERQRESEALRQAAAQAEVLAAECRQRQHASDAAQDRLLTIKSDATAFDRLAADATRNATDLATAEREQETASAAAADTQAQLAAVERAVESANLTLTELRAAAIRAARQIKRRRALDEADRLARILERCQTQAVDLEALARQRAELPELTPAKLRALEKAENSLRDLRAQIQALGLTLELSPKKAAPNVRIRADDGAEEALPRLAAGETATVRAASSLVIELPGWGRLCIRSGAKEPRALEESLRQEESAWRARLEPTGARDLAEARALAERARQLDTQLAAARTALAALLDSHESLDALCARLAAERRLAHTLAAELDLAPDAPAPALSELEAAEERTGVQQQAQLVACETLAARLKSERQSATAAATRREHAQCAALTLRHGAQSLASQSAALRGRYANGLAAALQAAELAWVKASVLFDEARQKLPPDVATLGERNRRAAAAAAELRLELETRRRARDELRGRLELLGSQALYSRETDLLVRRDALAAQADDARTRSRAAGLLRDLIERRQHAATRTVLGPLQERLSARFAEVSGERDRQIFLDADLRVTGLGRTRDELVAFDDLSQGAKEQLLLCLRLAVAQELAATPATGPQCLILDDALVHTDAGRQHRVLDALVHAASGGLQILVCTCHPDRYRGAGEVVTIRR